MILRALLVPVVVMVVAATGRAQSMPVEHFARPPGVTRLRLSPDGQCVAFVRTQADGVTQLCFLELANDQLKAFGVGTNSRGVVSALDWISDRRVAFQMREEGGVAMCIALNRDGSNRVSFDARAAQTVPPIRGRDRDDRPRDSREPTEDDRQLVLPPLFTFGGSKPQILASQLHVDSTVRELRGRSRLAIPVLHPAIVRVDTHTGEKAPASENPGNVETWVVDLQGNVRAGSTREGLRAGMIWRPDTKAEWQTLCACVEAEQQRLPLGFDTDNRRLWVAALSADGRWAAHLVAPDAAELPPPTVADSEYDVAKVTARFAGEEMIGPVAWPRHGRVVGWRYLAPRPGMRWFDDAIARVQGALDRAMPDTANVILDRSTDGKRYLVLACSETNPGSYFLLEPEAGRLRQLALRMDWMTSAPMAAVSYRRIRARDGLEIPVTLTMPGDAGDARAPLVVVLRAYEEGVVDWGFDPFAQLLASRGYIVAHVVPRGRAGYGHAFWSAGKSQVGRAIESDIEDAVRTLLAAEPRIDAARVAIIGASEGGSSALFALAHQPEMFRCGIAIDAITDWVSFYVMSVWAEANPNWRAERQRLTGDPITESEALRAASAVNFAARIRAPLLVVSWDIEGAVPPDQSNALVTALRKVGARPAVTRLYGRVQNPASHPYAEAFPAIVAFLEKQL